MDRERFVHNALWVSAVFNAIAAVGFAFPESVGQIAGMPTPVPRFWSVMVTLFVLLFAGMYAWMAMQPRIHRPMLALASIGKGCAFFVMFALWLAGDLPARAVPPAAGDLILSAIFAWYLLAERDVAASPVAAPSRVRQR